MAEKKKKKTVDPVEAILAEVESEAATPRREPPRGRARKAVEAGMKANAGADPSGAMAAMMDHFTKDSGGVRVVTTAEAQEAIIGLELPALCLRKFFGNTVLPCSRSIMIYGKQGTNKSSLLAEIYRWVMLQGGLAAHVEVENKDNPDLRDDIFWHDPDFANRVPVTQANSQDEWMAAFIRWIQSYDKIHAKSIAARKGLKPKQGEKAADFKARTAAKQIKGNPGYIRAMVVGVDSLTSAGADGTIQKIEDDGSPSRRFADEARSLSDFAKCLPRWTRDRPVILVLINHLKDKQDPNTQATIDSIPGGLAMRYMDTTEIKVARVGRINTYGFTGNTLRLTLTKNSLGPDMVDLVVDFKTWWQDGVSYAAFDWDKATIRMLLDSKLDAPTRARIARIVDLNPTKGETVWSERLGIPEARPVSYSEAGRILEGRRDLTDALLAPLQIRRRTPFTPGIEYGAIKAQIARHQEEKRIVFPAREIPDVAREPVAAAKAKADPRTKAKVALVAAGPADDEEDDD